MEIWYNPSDGQVMAVYSHRYAGQHWSDQGYERAEVPDAFARVTRDHRVTVEGGVVTGIEATPNPVQPTPSGDELRSAAEAALIERLLEREGQRPDAPQAVKEYLARRPA